MTYSIINAIVVKGDAGLSATAPGVALPPASMQSSAAQAHGMATGMLCANEQTQSADWLTELFLDATPVANEEKATLAYLFEETQRLLASDDFEFSLLLPGDEALLSEQVEALTYWCQGFLLGLGVTYAVSDLSREASEILKDIVEFTKLDTEAEGEEDESDFMEITEYIKSAVLLLRSELNKK